MFIDTHFHLNKSEAQNLINEAYSQGVERLIACGCDKTSILDILKIIEEYDNVYATVGFHPSEVSEITDDDIKWLGKIVVSNKKIVGIGEIGLDYYYGKENKSEQINLFNKQLNLAEKLNLPVVIHTRDAFLDTYETLKKYQLKGIIHCFSGSLEVANQYVNLGYCLGIGGVLTFKNSNLPSVIEKLSLENVVLETDSPYLAPVPYRGQINSPKNIPIIAEKIAEIKKVSTKEVENITCNNTLRIFDLGG